MLYHVGIPGISGGYVGVDVFFVISGFLIISQIVAGLQRGTFSFGEFWARRALRILPPYLLVLAVTAALAPFVLVMPDEFRAFSREVRDAALMVVNHLYLSQQGYFDTSSDTKVLLHLWSLAVEEQFYLVAPCLTVLLWQLPVWLQRPALRSRLLLWAALLMFGGSLAGCILLTSGGRNYAFYLTVLRAWEFIAGGAIGFLVPLAARLPRRLHGWLAAAGLAAILVAAASFRSDTLYPSWRAMVPVFGATAVILAGLADPKTPVIRLLAAPPLVWIGLVSYAWYLWHWPLLALSRIHNFGERDLASDLLVGADFARSCRRHPSSCRAADPSLVPDAHETPGLAAGVCGHDHGDSHRRRGLPGLPGTCPQRRCRDRSGLCPEVGETVRLLRSDVA